jgi:hypothetical protein
VREAAPALLAFDGEDLESVARTCVKEIGKMTAALWELAGRMGYNPESEEGRKGFGELLARIAKVKTDACNIYDVPPPLMALKAIITYYQVLPALAYGFHVGADFHRRYYMKGEKVPPPDFEGLVLKEEKVGSAVAKWAEAAPGAVTQAHKDAFSCYRRAVKETPKPAKVTELAELPDIAVLATTPSAFFGLGDDKTCFASGRLNYHHKYYLALLDNSFSSYTFLAKAKGEGGCGAEW